MRALGAWGSAGRRALAGASLGAGLPRYATLLPPPGALARQREGDGFSAVSPVPLAASLLGQLRELPPGDVLAVLKSLVDAFSPSGQAHLDAAAPAKSEQSFAREASKRLFEEAVVLADHPEGWVTALRFDELWYIPHICVLGRRTDTQVPSINHARRLMGATDRAVRAHVDSPTKLAALRQATSAPVSISNLCMWTMQAGKLGALSSTNAHRLWGTLAAAALGVGVGAFRTRELCKMLHAYTRAQALLGGGPDPLSELAAVPNHSAIRTRSGQTLADHTDRTQWLVERAKADGRRCRQLMLALYGELAERAPSLTGTELSRVAWSIGVSGLPAQPLLRALARALPAATPSLSAAEACTCLWALCCRGYYPRDVIAALVAPLNALDAVAVRELFIPGEISARRAQLSAIDLALRHEGPWALRPTPELSPHLLGLGEGMAAGASKFSAGMVPGASSDLHLQVSALLSEMSTAHENEPTIASLGCVVDVLLTDSPVVLEILGPTHYAFGGTEITGSSALKLRLLRLEGWLVVELPYYEWNALLSVQARREYLAGKIAGNTDRALDASVP